jgi:predicted deacylase
LDLPVLLVRGRNAGKTLVVFAGVHGDEYEGVRAILDLYEELDPGTMSGDFLAISVANPPAFWAASRTSPLDEKNLARVFPGHPAAAPTDAIAHVLGSALIARADFFLDLHSAGVKLLMPTMVGYDANDARTREAAMIFGTSVLWAHSYIPPGRTISFAREHNIPWLYTEARGAGRIHPDDLRLFKQGIRNLLQHLSILPGIPPQQRIEIHLDGGGNIDESLLATRRGILIPEVEFLQSVTKGETLGRLVNLHGETLEVVQAPRDGVVALIRQCITVETGDPMFLVAGKLN